MAPGLQVRKSQGIAAEFRRFHVKRVPYMYDTQNKKIHKEN
jgi:hypothetical protein